MSIDILTFIELSPLWIDIPSGIPNATSTVVESFIPDKSITSVPISLTLFKISSGPVIPISVVSDDIDFSLKPLGNVPVVFIFIGTVFPSLISIVASTHFCDN